MHESPVVFSIFLIFAGAALLATLALYARQAMPVAYILVGVLFGPSALGLVADAVWIKDVSDIGIMFLLYLLGLNLLPGQLVKMFREALWVTVASSALFALCGYGLGTWLGLARREALLVGAVSMFSSTILGLKLLPTSTLHHQRMGQVVISVLLLQDLLAILLLLLLQGYGQGGSAVADVALQLLKLGALVAVAALLEGQLVERLIARFDQIHEYVFLIVIAWCLGIAELARLLGLSQEIGAFVAGVALASSPVSQFIAESLKPLRDFFLVLFFFSLGAGFPLHDLGSILWPSACVAVLALALKPVVFGWLLARAGEKPGLSVEIGVRLGQISEFSLLIAVVALDARFIGERASRLLQLATLLTFVVSSYWIVMRYPTPIAVSERLRRD